MVIFFKTLIKFLVLGFLTLGGCSPNGKYEGAYLNKKPHGYGTYTFNDGEKYKGEWKNGKRTGYGTNIWKTGEKYIGYWKNSKRNGIGINYYVNGSKFSGRWVDDLYNGKGTFSDKSGLIKEGVWRNGKFLYKMSLSKIKKSTEISKFSSSNHKKLVENLNNNTQNLKDYYGSIERLKNDNQLSTKLPTCPYNKTGFKHNCHGKIITNIYQFIGEFKNNKKHGKGIYTYTKNNEHQGYTHSGEYLNGKRHGYGIATWKNGQRYEGDYKNGNAHGLGIFTYSGGDIYEGEVKYNKRNGEGVYRSKNGIVQEGIWKDSKFVYSKKIENTKNKIAVLKTKSNLVSHNLNISSDALNAERRKRIELERELATLLAKQKEEEQIINADIRKPMLEIISNKTRGKRGTIKGIAKDNSKVAEVTVDGQPIKISSNGNFEYSTYVPAQGLKLKVEVTDVAGLTVTKIVDLKGNLELANPSISFDRLNPLGKIVKSNPNALALIIGVSSYENTKAKALYADNDALVFKDYATEKLGISENRIKILLNDRADERDILLSVQDWVRRSVKPNKSDIYVFFAGHGLASQDGKNMYLLPHDGSPRLLSDTAILRDRLFADLKTTNPKSVTIFLDTCYSGITRKEEMLIAGRPIMIKAKRQSIPNGFTLFSAASNEQISRPLEEVKHGIFSYFLMKGMEGDADTNTDNKITAQELHAYVKENVTQQSSGSQTPELQGDKDRVIVQFK